MQITRTDITKDKGKSLVQYDDFSEFMDYVAKEPSKELGTLSSRTPKCRYSSDDWYGTKSIEEAMTLAREGWPEGLESIKAITARLDAVSGSFCRKQEIYFDVTGDFADAGLFATGVPECMGAFTETEIREGKGKIVRILMNLSVSAGVEKDAIIRRGAAAVALIDALESTGRSCEVIIASGTSSGGWQSMHLVTVKNAGEPVELDRMAFLLAHPSSFRRLFFSAWEHEPTHIRERIGIVHEGGYGRCHNHKDPQADIIIPTMDLYQFPDDKAILGWIKRQLHAQGCEIEGEEDLKLRDGDNESGMGGDDED